MPDPALERDTLALFERLLDVPEPERSSWVEERTRGRPALATRLAAMLQADRIAALGTGGASDMLEDEVPPARIGAYRIAERIGRGGMGSVYRGERMAGDFAHAVAIKVIKPGLLSEALVERFERERQLLAGLVHPNIAQLYDGGETEGGSPYLIMELVEGLPLLDWVHDRRADRGERQRLFLDICRAVAFAHRNLVVHRDLTPSNVLVTYDGVVKLIDFGIARPPQPVGRSDSPKEAAAGSLSLTPGYAAPERMSSGAIATTADIYSLGKVLKKLIPPVGNDRELTAIIARATADDPAARYPTADALHDDVAAWRDGRPVAAIAGGWRYRSAKLLRRHWLPAGAAAGALAIFVAAFAMVLLANGRAEAARVEAEQRFQQTRSIAKSLLFESFDEVSRVPGSTLARAHLAQTGLRYLEALGAQEAAPLDVRVEIGRGYLRLAQVIGGGYVSQLGRYDDANQLLARSEAILAPLLLDHPDDPQVRQAMAALLIEQSGVNAYNNNEPELARDQGRRARALMEPSARNSLEEARLFANALRSEAESLLWIEDYPAGRDLLQDALGFIGSLPPAMQRDQEMMSIRAATFRFLGEAYHELQEPEPARRALDEAVAINRAVAAARPDDPLLRRRVVTSLRYRAVVHRTNDRNELARQSIDEARAHARWLRDRDPNDVGAAQIYGMASEVHSQVLADLGRFEESYAAGEEARAAHEFLVTRSESAPGTLRSLAQVLRTNAANRYAGGDYSGACGLWQEMIGLFTDLERRGALTDRDRNNTLSETRTNLARACNPPRRGLGARAGT